MEQDEITFFPRQHFLQTAIAKQSEWLSIELNGYQQKQDGSMKRQRGRGRKPGNPNNRSYESNGPDVKIRGNASQIYEKYLQYARDAQTSGDRIAAEAYFQHAEHYFRIVAANTPKEQRPQLMQDDQDDMRADEQIDDQDSDEDDDNGSDVDSLKVVDGEGEPPEQIKSSSDDEDRPRRRTRRPRRKPNDSSENGENKAAPENKASSDDKQSDHGDDAGLRAMMARSSAPDVSAEPAE